MNQFDYVAYDEDACAQQTNFKSVFTDLAAMVESDLKPGRAQSLALTKLEEAYMWVGKSIRDEQLARNGGFVELQEERKNQ